MNEPATEVESEQLKQLSVKLEDLHFDSERFGKNGFDLCVRFLREKKHNLKEAEDAIRKYMKFRAEQELDTISSWQPSESAKPLLEYEFCGFDESGCPVYYLPSGKWDLKKLCSANLGHECLKTINQIFELAELQQIEQSKLLQRPINGGIVLLGDLTGFSIRKVLGKKELEIILEVCKVADTFYVRPLKFCATCNVPRTFAILWKIVKPLLRAELRNKLEFHASTTTTAFRQSMQIQGISQEVIPTVLGGSYQLSKSCGGAGAATGEDDNENDVDDEKVAEEFEQLKVQVESGS